MPSLRIREQLVSCRWAFLVIVVVSAIPLFAAVLLHSWKGMDYGALVRDPVVVANAHVWTGFISQLGIFFWAGAAAICFLASAALTRISVYQEIRRFLLASGALTLFLGLDDIFLFHEEVFPGYLGIPESLLYAVYVGWVSYYLFRFRFAILDTEYLLLLAALSGFALSVLSDLLNGPFLYEDGVKLIGLVAWLTYYSRTSYFAIRRAIARARGGKGGGIMA